MRADRVHQEAMCPTEEENAIDADIDGIPMESPCWCFSPTVTEYPAVTHQLFHARRTECMRGRDVWVTDRFEEKKNKYQAQTLTVVCSIRAKRQGSVLMALKGTQERWLRVGRARPMIEEDICSSSYFNRYHPSVESAVRTARRQILTDYRRMIRPSANRQGGGAKCSRRTDRLRSHGSEFLRMQGQVTW